MPRKTQDGGSGGEEEKNPAYYDDLEQQIFGKPQEQPHPEYVLRSRVGMKSFEVSEQEQEMEAMLPYKNSKSWSKRAYYYSWLYTPPAWAWCLAFTAVFLGLVIYFLAVIVNWGAVDGNVFELLSEVITGPDQGLVLYFPHQDIEAAEWMRMSSSICFHFSICYFVGPFNKTPRAGRGAELNLIDERDLGLRERDSQRRKEPKYLLMRCPQTAPLTPEVDQLRCFHKVLEYQAENNVGINPSGFTFLNADLLVISSWKHYYKPLLRTDQPFLFGHPLLSMPNPENYYDGQPYILPSLSVDGDENIVPKQIFRFDNFRVFDDELPAWADTDAADYFDDVYAEAPKQEDMSFYEIDTVSEGKYNTISKLKDLPDRHYVPTRLRPSATMDYNAGFASQSRLRDLKYFISNLHWYESKIFMLQVRMESFSIQNVRDNSDSSSEEEEESDEESEEVSDEESEEDSPKAAPSKGNKHNGLNKPRATGRTQARAAARAGWADGR